MVVEGKADSVRLWGFAPTMFHADGSPRRWVSTPIRSPRTSMELLADEAPRRFAVRRRGSVTMGLLADGVWRRWGSSPMLQCADGAARRWGFVPMMLRADEAVRRWGSAPMGQCTDEAERWWGYVPTGILANGAVR